MSQKHNSRSRFFCAVLIGFVSLILSGSLHAQVPTNIVRIGIPAIAESALPIGSKVVKIMDKESAIPFGTSVGSGNLALLQVKGNDQEYTRKFTFKNTSSISYRINSIDFEKKDNRFEFMSVESGESLPIEAPPGHTFTIRIAFHATEPNLPCYNKLNFNTEGEEQPISYCIQGKQESWQTIPANKATASTQTN